MKTFLGLVSSCLLLIAMAIPSSAQSYGTATAISGGTNNVAAGATNTYSSPVFDLRREPQIALLISYKQATAGSSNITVRFRKSIDNSTWEVTPSIVIFANSTNFVTNVGDIGAVGYIRPATVENTNALAITNVTVVYSIKPSLRGN